jgi:amidohydrolase
MINFFERAVELAPELIKHRRTIHQNAEVGMELPKTSAYVFEQLEKMGYQPKYIAGSGVTAVVGKPGKTILLRADMDALPFKEESGLPFASGDPEAAHCCGHDLHTAMLLGAARLLKENEDSLAGTVKLMFQPGEEVLEGALAMLENGILENPRVDAAMGIHVNSKLPCGALIVFHGPTTASSDSFTIRVTGKGCHGSRPNEGVDPIAIICHIHTALQQLQARELAAGETGVVTVGRLHAGNADNAIPSEAVMGGTIRTFNPEVRRMLLARIPEICENVAKAFRGTAKAEFSPRHAITMVCDEDVSAQVRDALLTIYKPQQVMYLAKHFPGAEDFGFVAEKVPTSFVALGASIGPDAEYGQHHPKVQFNEKCLPVGAAAYAQAAASWLENNQ